MNRPTFKMMLCFVVFYFGGVAVGSYQDKMLMILAGFVVGILSGFIPHLILSHKENVYE